MADSGLVLPSNLLRDISIAVTTIEAQLPTRAVHLGRVQDLRQRVVQDAQASLRTLAAIRKHLITTGCAMDVVADFGLAAKPPQQPREILSLSRRTLGTNLFHADTEQEIPPDLVQELEGHAVSLDAALEELETSDTGFKSVESIVSANRSILVNNLEELHRFVMAKVESPRREKILTVLGWETLTGEAF